ncbi:unnamed protein product [Blepharisma stoltei]|uniref:GYF domain-containing protein n=1 Tax=Blepharisma stoltei TaxID=1481888 RepID=A0AAU9IXC2_9CILI|nr:unnamed protein product [Blepharisma stoltei]
MFKLEEIHWYYIDEAKNDEQVGPFTINEFKEKFIQGIITRETYCWHEEIDNWELLNVIQLRGRSALSYLEPSADTKHKLTSSASLPKPIENLLYGSSKPQAAKLSMKDEIALRVKERQERNQNMQSSEPTPAPQVFKIPDPVPAAQPNSVKDEQSEQASERQDRFSSSFSQDSESEAPPVPRGLLFEEELRQKLKKKFAK